MELAFAITASDGRACLFDYIWLDERVLAAAALRLNRDGLDGALELASLRQLLRALLVSLRDPSKVIEHLLDMAPRDDLDAAIVQLDMVAARLSSAQTGRGAVTLAGAPAGTGEDTIDAGSLIWLSVCGETPKPAESVPVEGLQAVVDAMLKDAGEGAAGILLFKTPAGAQRGATFRVVNDRRDIPTFLSAARRFLSQHELLEDNIAELEVALDEILTNQINYGYRDGLRHEILVSMAMETDLLKVEIRDEGEPFDPLSVPQPDLSADIDDRQIGGLGMHFVRTLLDKVTYQRRNGWNILALEKGLTPGRDGERG